MPILQLVCLGTFGATLVGQTPVILRTDKVQGLLIYLALEPRPHRRETLAGLFWPEQSDSAALTNLRTSLYRLRQPLEQAALGSTDALFSIDRQTVALNPGSFETDAQTFEDLIAACKMHPHTDLPGCDACLTRLAQAVALYQEDLLAGFSVSDAPAFEEWLVLRREGLHQKRLGALYDLAVAHEGRAGEEAQQYAQQLLALEPWREDAHRLLMRILAKSGQTRSALAQYQLCRQVLAAELGIEPASETTALYEQIRTGNLPSTATYGHLQSGKRMTVGGRRSPRLGRDASGGRLSWSLGRAGTITVLVGTGSLSVGINLGYRWDGQDHPSRHCCQSGCPKLRGAYLAIAAECAAAR